MHSTDERIPVLYLAPWVDIGGSDTSTIDWFRSLDRERFRASLITTQPSLNRRLIELAPYAEELWELPQLMRGNDFPRFILSFIHTRGIRLVHIMNSRLGFELLPDIVCLPDRPRVVVQFHAEEPNRAGYVRYVTTRYGNLVDAFSLTSQVLSDRLEDYDVPVGKRRVIPIGVDAEESFCPDRVRAMDGIDSDAFQILFPARLTAQKDPLLMVDVAARLRATGLRFQIQVLGEGDLTEAVRERIVASDLHEEVLMHGAQVGVAPWYAACDAVLLTSAFEGLPCAAYEAMAMGLPIIAPDLPGLDELVVPGTGVLVRPRADASAYVSAIFALAADRAGREAIGAAARARVRSGFSLERMATEHESLYDELLSESPRGERPRETPPGGEPTPAAGAFRDRRAETKPPVSVIVTCFNQGRYLRGCLESVTRQTYEPIETILVDDCSTERETVDALARIEAEGAVTVVRLPTNRGPAAARNAGIERARGRYVLPLDGDDLLLEGAIAELVEQLRGAGARIGFIYPNMQFFGNRTDYVKMPAYNLHVLLSGNYCAISSLIDREVFDRGFRYPEEIRLGHEDWDFVLTLAEHGIYGEPAQSKTLLCRKHGFTRNDLVEANVSFGEVIAARHPGLFTNRAAIKGEWSPALTLIAIDRRLETGHRSEELASGVASQTCPDFELIVRTGSESWPTGLERRLRHLPCEPAASRGRALAEGLRLARGRYALASYGCAAELLGDPALVEKVLRLLNANPTLAALALADSGPEELPYRLLDGGAARAAMLGALCWTTTGPTAPRASFLLDGQHPLEALARWLGAHATVQWRHLPLGEHRLPIVRGDGDDPRAAIGDPRELSAGHAWLRESPPALPDCPPGIPHRLKSMTLWRPPQSRLLCRHWHPRSGHHLYTNETTSPDGCRLDHVLGCVREYPLSGTTPLLRGEELGFVFAEPAYLRDPDLLGFVEQTPLPLFDPVLSGRHPETGQWVLVAGDEDPLAAIVQDPTIVGYIEPHPIRPRSPAHIDVTYGLTGLVRTVDRQARRHRYGAGWIPTGVVAGELGALFAEPTGDCDPLWIADGHVFAAADAPLDGHPSVRTALRWTGDPLTWKGFSQPGAKIRASARRAYDSARIFASTPVAWERPSKPAGYLLRSATSRTVPLYAARHPVTGDQLLSTVRSEAGNLGYREVRLLGHLVAQAPLTGELGPTRPIAPWAARFGLTPLETAGGGNGGGP